MSQEEILEYNKLCAVFLGWDYNKFMDRWNEENFQHKYSHTNSIDLKFHSDWNWIMDVIFKINILPNSKDQSDTTLQTHRVNVQSTLRSANMEAVVLSINKFLIWYNEAKK